MVSEKIGAGIQAWIGAYILAGALLAAYANISIFPVTLEGSTPWTVFLAALLSLALIIGALTKLAERK